MRRDLSEIADRAIDERAARIVLALACEPGDQLAPQLVAAHGAVDLVRQVSDGALQGETPRLARWRQDVAGRLDLAEVSRVLLQTEELGLGTLIPGEPGWPALAGNPATHPLVLWTRGDSSHLTSDAPRVAVIGARVPTDYGRDVARALAIDLADRRVTILGSGWPGVDATAVLGAALAGGPAIAVLPAGLDRPYPSSNANLFRATVANGGVLVSACPPGRDTNRTRTQARGRLLAALADAVVVTEGAYRSHAIKIAQEAVRLGVPVGAVPGPITDVTSTGTNDLLQRRVARIITHATDATNLITAPRPATPAAAGRSSGQEPVAPRPGNDSPSTPPALIPL
ncbi:DNA-processing protein DprA [Promicromonospora iranensis]|uniref:DNA processing protein n=1 Tax=Promicromonospora iranensis TaxID=1105144 RepID=A0ABU2CIT5_9MICO|nr:DNA-processing protein DprA [Promicromonospora iranensis]MDR7381251.1 DNA processing protein [Promicromonospora iranensis]